MAMQKIVLCERLSSLGSDYRVEHWEYASDRPTVAFVGPEDEAKVIAAAFVQVGYADCSGRRCQWCAELLLPPAEFQPGECEHNDGTKHRYERLCPRCAS
jgi:hypothetical protein